MNKQLLFGSIGCVLSLLCMCKANAQQPGDPQLNSLNLKNVTLPQKEATVLSPELGELSKKKISQRGGSEKPVFTTSNGIEKFMQYSNKEVIVDIAVNDDVDQAKKQLQRLGVTITGSYGRVISAKVPLSVLPQLDALNTLKYVRPAYKPASRPAKPKLELVENSSLLASVVPVKPVKSQGDSAQRSHAARKKYKVDGTGVKVGVMSDSYDNLGTAADGVSGGELPGPGNPLGHTDPVEILLDLDPAYGGIDEGRGMAEIVHDVAPGAELAFRTAFYGQGDMAQGIQELADAGCKVIVDDIIYFAEPFYQDGIIAQSVDEVKKKGVTYFSCALNYYDASYESNFRASSFAPFGVDDGTAHNFSAPGQTPRYLQPVNIPTGGDFLISFQWDEPFFSAGGKGSKSDLDIYLLDFKGDLVAYSFANNIASGDPVELMYHYNSTSNTTFYLLVLKFDGPDPKKIKYVNFGYSDFYVPANPPIPGLFAPTSYGHSKADGSSSVAAAPFFKTPFYGVKPPMVEWFSSLGGVPNYFDKKGNRLKKPLLRQKPEITAPDGANTSFFPPAVYFGNADIPQDKDTYPNFFGTSAAAPHAAGVAALMIEARKGKSYTPEQIRFVLATRVIDMDNPYTAGFDKGYDYLTGTGLINAESSVGAVYEYSVNSRGTSGVSPEITTNVEVFPNPTTRGFRVKLNLAASEKAELQLFALDGKLLYKKITPSKGITEIDATPYKAGIYILKIKQGDFLKTYKLVKQ